MQRLIFLILSASYASAIWFAEPMDERPDIPPVKATNEMLKLKSRLMQKVMEPPDKKDPLLKGPETVVIKPTTGEIYAITDYGLVLIKDLVEQGGGITYATTELIMKDMGGGRALGGAFTSDGNYLYLADLVHGLIRIENPSPTAKIEMLANSVVLEDGTVSPIRLAEDVAIGPQSGKIYFTDATDIPAIRNSDGSWDVVYTSMVDCLRGGAHRGRILEYDPSSNTTRVVVQGLHFANGIAVGDANETFLMVSETCQARSQKYYLKGPKAGTMEPVNLRFAAYPDGMDCGPKVCLAALPTPPPLALRLMYQLPYPLDMMVRTLLLWLPRSLAPTPIRFGGVAMIVPGDAEEPQRWVRNLYDANGENVDFVTGATYYQDKLYMGFLRGTYIAIFDLEPKLPPIIPKPRPPRINPLPKKAEVAKEEDTQPKFDQVTLPPDKVPPPSDDAPIDEPSEGPAPEDSTPVDPVPVDPTPEDPTPEVSISEDDSSEVGTPPKAETSPNDGAPTDAKKHEEL